MKHYGALWIWCGLTQLWVAWVGEPCCCVRLCYSVLFLGGINTVYRDLVNLLHTLKCSFNSCRPRQNINVFGISESEVFGSYCCLTGKPFFTVIYQACCMCHYDISPFNLYTRHHAGNIASKFNFLQCLN